MDTIPLGGGCLMSFEMVLCTKEMIKVFRIKRNLLRGLLFIKTLLKARRSKTELF